MRCRLPAVRSATRPTSSIPDLSALLDGGVFAAGSSVEVFASPESASASIVRELAELQRAEGREVDGEVRIERVRTFVTDLSEAIGFRVRERLAGTPVWRTYVRLRHGSIVGTAALVRADERDVRDRVAELAPGARAAHRRRARRPDRSRRRPASRPRRRAGPGVVQLTGYAAKLLPRACWSRGITARASSRASSTLTWPGEPMRKRAWCKLPTWTTTYTGLGTPG